MSNKIIMISGKQFCGKDTLAKIILKELSNFSRVGLGDAIKIEYGEKTGLSFDEIEKNKSVHRAELQKLANYKRSIDSDYWIKKIIDLPYDIIVPDVRVKREYEIFSEAKAFKIRVNATSENRAKRGVLAAENDVTEVDLDEVTEWEYVVSNDGTYEELVEKSQALISEIKAFFNLKN